MIVGSNNNRNKQKNMRINHKYGSSPHSFEQKQNRDIEAGGADEGHHEDVVGRVIRLDIVVSAYDEWVSEWVSKRKVSRVIIYD